MKYKLILIIISLVFFSITFCNCYAEQNTKNISSAPGTSNTPPQVAPNVVVTLSDQDLKKVDGLFKDSDYNHLQMNAQESDQERTQDKLFKISDLAKSAENNSG